MNKDKKHYISTSGKCKLYKEILINHFCDGSLLNLQYFMTIGVHTTYTLVEELLKHSVKKWSHKNGQVCIYIYQREWDFSIENNNMFDISWYIILQSQIHATSYLYYKIHIKSQTTMLMKKKNFNFNFLHRYTINGLPVMNLNPLKTKWTETNHFIKPKTYQHIC